MDKQTASSSFAERLRNLINEKGITQTELATRTSIERSEINRMVNGKRDPKPQEIGWLAEALDVHPKKLIEGVNIEQLETFEEEVERAREQARRVLSAERERDEAKSALKVQEDTTRTLEAGWRRERSEMQKLLATQRHDCADRLRQQEDELARREHELLTELSQLRDDKAALERDLRQARQLALNREQQIEHLQRSLAAERGKVAAVGIFGGLLGVAVGGLGGALAATDEDEDED